MARKWLVLDPFNNPQGPYDEVELIQVLFNLGDMYVMNDQMRYWQRASEIPDLGKTDVSLSESIRRDAHGQPLDHRINQARCADRDVQELLGLMKGVLADGHVSDEEVVALHLWTDTHPWAHDVWPINVLSDRLHRILDDGFVDEKERSDLTELLRKATGERPDASTAMSGATRLPLDHPPPAIIFSEKAFVFTGKFAYGTRKACEDAVCERGGSATSSVTRATDFVVIGTLASAQWAFSSYGRKIEKAVEIQRKGGRTAIVAEEHWVVAL